MKHIILMILCIGINIVAGIHVQAEESRKDIAYDRQLFHIGESIGTMQRLFPQMQKKLVMIDMWNGATEIPIFKIKPGEEIYTFLKEEDQVALYFAFSQGTLTKMSVVCNTTFPPQKLSDFGAWLNKAYDFVSRATRKGDMQTLVTPSVKITEVSWGGGEDGGGDTCSAYAFEAVAAPAPNPNEESAIQQGLVKRVGKHVWLVKPPVNTPMSRDTFTIFDAHMFCRNLKIAPWAGKWRLPTSEEMKNDLFRDDKAHNYAMGKRNVIEGIEGDVGNNGLYWVSNPPKDVGHRQRDAGTGFMSCRFQFSTWDRGFECVEQGPGRYGRNSSDGFELSYVRCVADDLK